MARPGEYDFAPLGNGVGYFGSSAATLSVGIFRWIYKADGHGLKKSKAVYRVKGLADRWKEINERARCLCTVWNAAGVDVEKVEYKRKRSETI